MGSTRVTHRRAATVVYSHGSDAVEEPAEWP